MTREFVSYEQALALKELGIDQGCYASYGPVVAQQVFVDILEHLGYEIEIDY